MTSQPPRARSQLRSTRFQRPGLALLVLIVLSACSPAPPEIASLDGQTMGTGYSIKLSPAPDAAVLERLQKQIERLLGQISQQFSTYIPTSELMRFNRNHSTDWQPVSRDLIALISQAAEISAASDGRYDVTVGPLVEAWGFGSAGREPEPPSPGHIGEILKRVGYRKLTVRQSPPALRKEHPRLEVDLSSIAKGWAVDRVSEILDSHGLDNHLVEIGGETRTRGQKSDGSPWRIAIERPVRSGREIQGALAVRDASIATSGDYRNFFRHGEQFFSHTIDPTSGQPVQHRLASVTVIANECAIADAWATALMALGEQRGPAVAESAGLKALFIVREDNELVELVSSALRHSGLWPAKP